MKFTNILKDAITKLKEDVKKEDMDTFRQYFNLERSADEKKDSIYKFFLDQLDCIDAKSSSLLTYDAIIMAVNIFFLSTFSLEDNRLIYIVLVINMLFSAMSAILCLFIIDIFGPHIIKDYNDVDQYIDITLAIVCKRTHIFRLALIMSRIHGIILLFIYAVILFKSL